MVCGGVILYKNNVILKNGTSNWLVNTNPTIKSRLNPLVGFIGKFLLFLYNCIFFIKFFLHLLLYSKFKIFN